jgi:hypothetical protein
VEGEMKSVIEVIPNTKLIFHYNKKHNEDQSVPPWVIKTKGRTYYIWHFDSAKPFSTKETPDNQSTKGSFQFRGDLTFYEEDEKLYAELK